VQLTYNGPVSEMRGLIEVLTALPYAASFALAVTEYESRDFSLVDVVGAGCSKGATLARWAAVQGVTQDEVMAVGDNLNDREMLEYAGLPVVMGNAVPALRRDGWPMTETNDEAGVAAAIARFALSTPI